MAPVLPLTGRPVWAAKATTASPPSFSVCRSIGYVEYAYAKQNNPAYTKLVSADGKPVSPTEESFSNAAKGVDWSKTFAQDLTDQKGDNVANHLHYLHPGAQRAENPAQGAEVLKFFDWAYKTGGKQANELDYATLPKEVVEQVRAARKPT